MDKRGGTSYTSENVMVLNSPAAEDKSHRLLPGRYQDEGITILMQNFHDRSKQRSEPTKPMLTIKNTQKYNQ